MRAVTRVVSTVSFGSSSPGSVSRTRCRTSCSHDRPVRERKSSDEDLFEGRGVVQLVVEAAEEPELLPGDGGAYQLFASPGKMPVDTRPRHAGLARRVLDGGLGDPPSGDARVGRLEDSLPGFSLLCRTTEETRSAVRNRGVGRARRSSPSTAGTARTARRTPGMNEVRSYAS